MEKEHQTDSGRMPVRVRPYAHQAEAYGFALDQLTEKGGGAALLMEMGTGKTLVGITVTGTLYQMALIRRVLVVAPLSVLSVWEDEFSRMAAFPFGFTRLTGSISNKKTQLEEIPTSTLQIVAVNYESAWRLEPELIRYGADLIISDEGHRIKDSQTRQSRALHRLGDRARYRMLLTGTLITNREIDVYSQYRFVNRLIFGDSFYRFRNRYFDMTGYGNHTPKFRSSMLDEFLNRLHSCAYRVTNPHDTCRCTAIRLFCICRLNATPWNPKNFRSHRRWLRREQACGIVVTAQILSSFKFPMNHIKLFL